MCPIFIAAVMGISLFLTNTTFDNAFISGFGVTLLTAVSMIYYFLAYYVGVIVGTARFARSSVYLQINCRGYFKNFIIGIGGTGAKCLEHLLHSCAADLVQKTFQTGMVDQDEANGNVSRTKILLSKYEFKSTLRDESGDLAENVDFSKLISLQITTLFGYL